MVARTSRVSMKSVYSHYIADPLPTEQLPINETELYRAMEEAKRSYEEWKHKEQALRVTFKALGRETV